MPEIRGSFIGRHLDPASHMGEILFGLIMTLTFTLAAGILIQEEGREGAREMLIGILGCNLAWGIIDGVLYVLGQVFERGRLRRIGFHLRQAKSDLEARQMVAEELDQTLTLLFYVGWRWSRHTLAKPWLAGLTFLLVGLLLVALAIPLGG